MVTSNRFGMKRVLFMVLLGALVGVVSFGTPLAEAARGTTVIEGPGFHFEEKKGWFGRSEQTYTDILGNKHSRKTGMFSLNPQQDSTFFGSQVVQKGGNVSVLAPGGSTVITHKRSLLGGEETHVNGHQLLDDLRQLLP